MVSLAYKIVQNSTLLPFSSFKSARLFKDRQICKIPGAIYLLSQVVAMPLLQQVRFKVFSSNLFTGPKLNGDIHSIMDLKSLNKKTFKLQSFAWKYWKVGNYLFDIRGIHDIRPYPGFHSACSHLSSSSAISAFHSCRQSLPVCLSSASRLTKIIAALLAILRTQGIHITGYRYIVFWQRQIDQLLASWSCNTWIKINQFPAESAKFWSICSLLHSRTLQNNILLT